MRSSSASQNDYRFVLHILLMKTEPIILCSISFEGLWLMIVSMLQPRIQMSIVYTLELQSVQWASCSSGFYAQRARLIPIKCQTLPFLTLVVEIPRLLRNRFLFECTYILSYIRKSQPVSEDCIVKSVMNKCLANANRPCDCSVLCLRPKSSLCSCPHCILDMTSFGSADSVNHSTHIKMFIYGLATTG